MRRTVAAGLVSLLVGVANLGTVLGAGPAQAAGRPKIAYTLANQIYTISPAGGPKTKLTSAGKNYAPQWSRDHLRLAYVHEAAGGSRDIWVMKADGTGKRAITHTGDIKGNASWSPDGKQLVATLGAKPRVAKISVATGTVALLHFCGGEDEERPLGTPCAPGEGDYGGSAKSSPAWSPDGRYIVFNSEGGAYDQIMQVYAGENRVAATITGDGGGGSYGEIGSSYSWAPDSTSWVVDYRPGRSCCVEPSPPRITSWALPGQVPPAVPAVNNDADPSYSPDGTQLVFVHRTAESRQIMVTDLDGTNRRVLAPGYSPAW